jgi:DNA repair photolyase
MKRLDNPPNPYESHYQEWLEPAPETRVEVYEELARSIIAENDSPDVGFRWSVNPYRGCQHACIYCYARPSHEYLGFGAGTDFETRLVVKTNSAELLDEQLRQPAWAGEHIVFSGITDCYQPLEAVYGLTRRCLEVCTSFHNPASVITKSYLVCRDVDVLSELHAAAGTRVMFSIPFRDAEMARTIEPGAPPPERRFEAMRRIADAGVPVGIMVAPLIPGLNDGDVPELLARAADCGAKTAGYVALRLPGSVEPVFLARLRERLPLRAQRVENRIREVRNGRLYDCRFEHRMTGTGTYWKSIEDLFDLNVRKYGLNEPFQPPRASTFHVPNSTKAGAQLQLFA